MFATERKFLLYSISCFTDKLLERNWISLNVISHYIENCRSKSDLNFCLLPPLKSMLWNNVTAWLHLLYLTCKMKSKHQNQCRWWIILLLALPCVQQGSKGPFMVAFKRFSLSFVTSELTAVCLIQGDVYHGSTLSSEYNGRTLNYFVSWHNQWKSLTVEALFLIENALRLEVFFDLCQLCQQFHFSIMSV